MRREENPFENVKFTLPISLILWALVVWVTLLSLD